MSSCPLIKSSNFNFANPDMTVGLLASCKVTEELGHINFNKPRKVTDQELDTAIRTLANIRDRRKSFQIRCI